MMNEIPLDAPSIEIRYRLDGGLFKLSRLRSQTKVTLHNFRELQYADDNDTVTQKPQDLQRTADQFNAAYKHFGMDVNTEKTKLLVQHASNRPQHIIPTVQAKTRTVESVPSFSYLGSLLSSAATCKDEMQNRIRVAHAAYGRLTERVFENHGLHFQTKVVVFRAVVLSTLLYACETWTLYSRDVKQLEKFQQAKLRQIFRVRWKDKITNNEILTRASLPSIEVKILQHRLRWVGHIARMPPTRLPKIILYGELAEGKRPRGGPKRRFEDQLKRSLAQANIPDWETIAHERRSHGRSKFEKA